MADLFRKIYGECYNALDITAFLSFIISKIEFIQSSKESWDSTVRSFAEQRGNAGPSFLDIPHFRLHITSGVIDFPIPTDTPSFRNKK